jgi:hypothetical protein
MIVMAKFDAHHDALSAISRKTRSPVRAGTLIHKKNAAAEMRSACAVKPDFIIG